MDTCFGVKSHVHPLWSLQVHLLVHMLAHLLWHFFSLSFREPSRNEERRSDNTPVTSKAQSAAMSSVTSEIRPGKGRSRTRKRGISATGNPPPAVLDLRGGLRCWLRCFWNTLQSSTLRLALIFFGYTVVGHLGLCVRIFSTGMCMFRRARLSSMQHRPPLETRAYDAPTASDSKG